MGTLRKVGSNEYPYKLVVPVYGADCTRNDEDICIMYRYEDWNDPRCQLPVEGNELPRLVQSRDEMYSVEPTHNPWIHPREDHGSPRSIAMFLQNVQVVILTYDIASMESFQKLWEIYDRIPQPGFYSEKRLDALDAGQVEHNRAIIVQIPQGGTSIQQVGWNPQLAEIEVFPMLLVGSFTGEDSRPKEVGQADIEKFLSNHPNCTFVGECNIRCAAEVDALFDSAIDVARELRALGQSQADSMLEPKAPAKYNSSSSLLSTKSWKSLWL